MAVGGSIKYEIDIDTSKAEIKLNQLGEAAGKVGNKGAERGGEIMGEKLLNGLKTVFSAIAVKKILTDTLTSGAKLEQSIGGIETLFGAKGAKSVEEYAQSVNKNVEDVIGEFGKLKDTENYVLENSRNAWKTAGVSMNAYNEGIALFAANLNRTTGDVQKSAEIADRIVRDASDNANKFGTNTADVLNVYKSLSRGMYQTLDNLNLGFAGTKDGAKELVKYAATLKDEMNELGVEIDANSIEFENMANAISVVQKHVGITGTTAREASETFSGSLSSMKAATENFMAALALGSEVDKATQALVQSVLTFGKNAVRMLVNIAKEIPSALSVVIDEMISFLSTSAIDGLIEMGKKMSKEIPNVIQSVLSKLFTISGKIKQLSPRLANAGMDLLINLADGMLKAIPNILKVIPMILNNIAEIISSFFGVIRERGWELLMTVLEGIWEALPTLLSEFFNIVQSLWNLFLSLNWLDLGSQVIIFIWEGIKAIAPSLLEFFLNIANTAWEWFKNVDWFGLGKQVLQFIVNSFISFGSTVWDKLKEIGNTAWDKVKNIDWANLGQSIIDGIKQGIANMAQSLYDKITSVVNRAKELAKGWLGIASPSKVFRDEVGEMIPLGIAQGIENESGAVDKSIDNMLDGIDTSLSVGDFNKNISLENNNDNIISILESYLPQIAKQKNIVLDTGALVGELSGRMNRKLGLAYNGQI